MLKTSAGAQERALSFARKPTKAIEGVGIDSFITPVRRKQQAT
jgi:hypothetical protein